MIIYFHRLLNPRLLEYLRSTWYLLSGIQGALPTWSLTDPDRVPRPSRQDGCIPALFYSTSSSLFDPFYSLPTDQIPLIVVGGRLENRRPDILIYRTPPTGRVSVIARVRLVSSFPHYLFLLDSLESLIFLFLLSSSSLCPSQLHKVRGSRSAGPGVPFSPPLVRAGARMCSTFILPVANRALHPKNNRKIIIIIIITTIINPPRPCSTWSIPLRPSTIHPILHPLRLVSFFLPFLTYFLSFTSFRISSNFFSPLLSSDSPP